MWERLREMLEGLESSDVDYKSYLEIKYSIYGGGGCGGAIDRGGSPLGDDSEDCDHDYEMFLKNTRQRGENTYSTTLEENGFLTFIHYERDGSSSDEEGSYDHGSEVESPGKGKCGSEGSRLEENMIDGDYRRYLETRYGSDGEGFVGGEDTPDPLPPKVDEAEPFTPISLGKRAMFPEPEKCNEKRKSNKKQRSSWSKVKEKYVDQDYAILMQAVNLHPEAYDSETDSGDDVVEINYATFCNGESSHSFSHDVHYCEVDQTCEPVYKGGFSQFRRMVMSELKKPFDEEEYERLLQHVNEKKPVEKNLELRHGRARSCPSSRVGKSYLEYHQDFHKKLQEAGSNKHERLNILRGFFLWLQHTPDAGAFKPWNDPTCLAAMPGG